MLQFVSGFKKILSNHASLLRSIYYNFKYLSFDQAIYLPLVVARKVRMTGKGKISILKWNPELPIHVYIGGHALEWMPSNRFTPTTISLNGVMEISQNFYFGSGGGIEVGKGATITFGNGFNATAKCVIVCRKHCYFGEDVLVSWDTLIMDSDQHTIKNLDGELQNEDQSIHIGSHVWISSKATILKGSVIGPDTVIGCNSVVSGLFDCSGVLIAGIPAKKIKDNIKWNLSRPSYSNSDSEITSSIVNGSF